PKLEGAYLLLAQLYVASNRQEEAIQKLNTFAEQNKSIPALMQLAGIHEQLKNFSAARDTYEKILAINGNFAIALNNLAIHYSEQLGQPDKAYEFAKKARDAAPNEPHISDTLGWISFKRGDYRGALPRLQESASKLDDPVIQYHLGMAQYMLGDEDASR